MKLFEMSVYHPSFEQTKYFNPCLERITHKLYSDMKKYGLHGKLMATQGNTDKLVEILLDAAEIISKTEGCYLYLVSKDAKDKQSVWVTEVWESKEAHDQSLNMEGVKDLISKAIPILDGQPEKGLELQVLGGYGI